MKLAVGTVVSEMIRGGLTSGGSQSGNSIIDQTSTKTNPAATSDKMFPQVAVPICSGDCKQPHIWYIFEVFTTVDRINTIAQKARSSIQLKDESENVLSRLELALRPDPAASSIVTGRGDGPKRCLGRTAMPSSTAAPISRG